ncbi:MAG: DUF1573 domain-containing protein [Planctomycetaceae bacterium]
MMRAFAVLLGVALSIAILSGVVWYNRYSPAAVKAAIDAKKAAERAKRARQLAEDNEAGTPEAPEGDEEAHAAEPPPLIAPEGPYPKAVIAQQEFDFGSMAKDEERKHIFRIKNEGTVPLKLSKGSTTCKCTISNLPTRELAPGGTVEIEISWTPRELDNNFRKEARIQTNDPDNAEIKLKVFGKVVQEFIVAPSHEWNFGNVAENTPAEVVTTISSALVDKFQIKSIESSHPNLTSVATPLNEEKLKLFGAKSGYEFKSTIAPGIPVGAYDQKLKLLTDLPGDKTISIAVKAFRAGPLRFLPARGASFASERMSLNMGRFLAKEGKTATLPIFVQGLKEDFKITELKADPDFLEVTLTGDTAEELSRRAYQLKFHVPPDKPIMSKTAGNPARLTIKTNHPDAAEIVIELLYVSY